MADISADSLLTTGEFKATTCTGTLTIAGGASGTLLSVSSSGGRRIRLTMLNTIGNESGITITADGVSVVNGLTLNPAPTSDGRFSIGFAGSGSGIFIGNIRHIEAFNTITITKASGNTSAAIFYALEQGF